MGKNIELQDDFGIHEREVITKRAVALIMIHAKTGDIWVQEDASDKPSTGRRKGDISIPFETEKEGEEGSYGNVLGGLAEIFDDVDSLGEPVMPRLAKRLFSMDSGYISCNPISYKDKTNGNTYICSPSILFYDGESIEGKPFDGNEAIPIGWMSTGAFLDLPYTRPVAKHLVTQLIHEGVLQQRLFQYQAYPELRIPVIPQGFSLREYYARREEFSDLTIREKYDDIPNRPETGGEFDET